MKQRIRTPARYEIVQNDGYEQYSFQFTGTEIKPPPQLIITNVTKTFVPYKGKQISMF